MARTRPEIHFDSLGWIERRWFDSRPRVLDRVRADLAIRSKFAEAGDEPINCMLEADGWVGLPWQYAADLRDEFRDTLLTVRDTSRGISSLEAERRPTPRTDDQREFFESLIKETRDHECVLVEAATGVGKTVAALDMIAAHGVNALVIVPSRQLALQWAEEAGKHLGLGKDKIGFVMGGRKHRIDRPLTIAVINNLLLDGIIHDNVFGTVVWDESHKLGAREFSRTMAMFNARHRVAMTATVERADGCDVMVSNYFGPVRVRAKVQAVDCTCYDIRYRSEHRPPPWMLKAKEGALMKWLSEDAQRNAIISSVANRLFAKGRNIIILSNFIEHAEALRRQFIIDNGVDEDACGLFTGSYTAEDGNRRRTSKRELERIKSDCPVIFGTYSMLSTGIDIPRMDAGIEATPRAHNVQAIGRIRRQYPGKIKGRWFSITDLALQRFVGYASRRYSEFEASGVVIKQLTPNQVL